MSNYRHYFINAAEIGFNLGKMTSQRHPSQEVKKSSKSDIYP